MPLECELYYGCPPSPEYNYAPELTPEYIHVYLSLQEIDGESLLTLDPEMMVNCMNIKTGPALKIHKHILDLKREYNIVTF